MAVVSAGFIPRQARDHTPHRLHSHWRNWSQTNCYVDLWVETLNGLGLEPLAMTGFTLSSDFEGTQWTFLKPPPEDLRAIFGIDVAELNVWRPIREHIEEQLELGVLLTIEVDAFYLPDTAGDAYHREHTKTTIVPRAIDAETRRMSYFHNAGAYILDGDDFDAILPPYGPGHGAYLAPYVERILIDKLRRDDPQELAARAAAITRDHVARRPSTNPMVRMGERLVRDLPKVAAGPDMDAFHRYMFGTCRQCGSAAELAADHLLWLEPHVGGGLAAAADDFREIARGAKSLQFSLARAAHGRMVDLSGTIAKMADAYDSAMAVVVSRLGA